jgi:predicted metalloprotease with PDZ domain
LAFELHLIEFLPQIQRLVMYYSILPINPAAHLYLATCNIPEPDQSGQLFSLPAWIPGSYMIREFAKNVVTMSATSGGKVVDLVKLDKSTWRAAPCDGPLELRYEVYAWDLSVRTAHLDGTHGYFNGTSVFVRVHGQEHKPVTVEILPPVAITKPWSVATAMSRAGAELYGFGRYCAANYDELIDHPVEMGCFTLATFDVMGVAHDLVITGRHQADTQRLCADLQRICETQVTFFGGLPRMERYLFLVMVVGEGYGGLEHRASCSLLCSRNDLPLPGVAELSEGYKTFLGLCSHEYFHTWNVKQIKPAAFMPYDLERESYTRQLWAFEGITSYYDDLLLLRSGLITVDDYLTLLAQGMTRVWMGGGRFKQSLADSSFDAWTKFYRQDENAPNAIVSYYAKGSVIALALDLTIRQLTQNERSLDDVMRRLWREYGQPAIGVPEGEIEKIAAEVAGAPLDEFFQRYLYGTDDPPMAELLAQVGIEFKLRPALSADDRGGRSSGTVRSVPKRVLGAKSAADPAGAKLVNIFSGGAAELAGLAAGDVIIALDQLKVTHGNLEALLDQYRAGDSLTVHAFRRDELMSFEVTPRPAPADRVELALQENVDEVTLTRRNRWLTTP